MRRALSVLGVAATVVGISVTGSAASPRTFVSGGGSDLNPCSLALPCRTLAFAATQTSPGGELVVLDSAGYGQATITQAMTITAPTGVYAGVTVGAGNGITVNAGPADVVVVRGLTFQGQGGFSAIRFFTGKALHVENVVVQGFLANGIRFEGPGAMLVKDSIVRNNNLSGISVLSTSGTATAALSNVRLEGNGAGGLEVGPGGKASIRECVASENGAGLAAYGPGPGPGPVAELNIEDCLSANNGTGVLSNGANDGLSIVRVSNSTVTDNAIGFQQMGVGVLLSRLNNTLEGNISPTSGIIGTFTPQ